MSGELQGQYYNPTIGRFEVSYGAVTVIGGDRASKVDPLSAALGDDPIWVSFDGTGFGTVHDLTDSDAGTFIGIEADEGSSGGNIVEDQERVSSFHLLFDTHEILYANGMLAHILYLGAEA